MIGFFSFENQKSCSTSVLLIFHCFRKSWSYSFISLFQFTRVVPHYLIKTVALCCQAICCPLRQSLSRLWVTSKWCISQLTKTNITAKWQYVYNDIMKWSPWLPSEVWWKYIGHGIYVGRTHILLLVPLAISIHACEVDHCWQLCFVPVPFRSSVGKISTDQSTAAGTGETWGA